MGRSSKKGPYINENLLKRAVAINEGKTEKRVLKTNCRASTISPDFIGLTVAVHSGKIYVPIYITEDMVGYKLGEFVVTRKFSSHGGHTERSSALK